MPHTPFREGRTQLYPEELSKFASWGHTLVGREGKGGRGAPAVWLTFPKAHWGQTSCSLGQVVPGG